MHAGANRVVLGRQPEGVVAHRVQDLAADPAAVVSDRVADRVVLEVADVRLAAGVGEHLQDVGGVLEISVVGDLPGALIGPYRLPAGLDLVGLVARGGHRAPEVIRAP